MVGTNAQRIVPLMLYHAPSYRSLARTGTFVGGMARELYAIKNIDGNNTPTGALIHPRNFVASGGSDCNTWRCHRWVWAEYY